MGSKYNQWMNAIPFRTTLITAGTLYAGGDILCQLVEKNETIDWKRCARMTIYGTIVFGISSFYWYIALDKYLAVIKRKSYLVAAKVACDEIIYAPFCIASFYYCLSRLERDSHENSVSKVKESFFPTFKVDLSVWPLAQTINFYFLPHQYRVLYISIASLFWNVYLSWMHNNRENDFETKESGAVVETADLI